MDESCGHFPDPHFLLCLPEQCGPMTEEPFGPVAPIATFAAFGEAVARASALPFGFAGHVFSRGLRTATLAAEALEVGMIGVNDMLLASAEAPFGGVEESGMGRQ